MRVAIKHANPITLWLLAALLPVVVAACSSRLFSYEGRTVSEPNRLTLTDGGPHTAAWSTSDVVVKYNYVWDDEQLKLAGQVDFDRHIYNFLNMDHFRLNLLLLDGEGVVLARQRLATALRGFAITPMAFDRNLAAPPGTRAIAFQYDGRASEGGGGGFGEKGGGRISWSFWQEPF